MGVYERPSSAPSERGCEDRRLGRGLGVGRRNLDASRVGRGLVVMVVGGTWGGHGGGGVEGAAFSPSPSSL